MRRDIEDFDVPLSEVVPPDRGRFSDGLGFRTWPLLNEPGGFSTSCGVDEGRGLSTGLLRDPSPDLALDAPPTRPPLKPPRAPKLLEPLTRPDPLNCAVAGTARNMATRHANHNHMCVFILSRPLVLDRADCLVVTAFMLSAARQTPGTDTARTR